MTSASGAKPFEEPIAIVGIACRLPGAPDPEAFWQLLLDGGEALGDVPPERWDGQAYYHPERAAIGKTCTRYSGFIEQVDGFDPEFFGISPREALHMDPQQRLALELTWEGLEDAAVQPHSLQGGNTGVFFGAMWTDYEKLHRIEDIAQHSGTGWHLGVVPGRTSYTLGLRGPSMAINTACSSSLVAVHLACRSLLAGESSLAVAGGVSLMLAPHVTVAMSKFGGTSPSSRTYAYDARADGYVRGEGGGVVVLRRLSEARARGERIYALIRGGAVNNDGFSEGLTAPSREAQQMVLEEAYAVAGVRPQQVDYVEGHGTGTAIGDPIEANALGAVLGVGRGPEQRWWLGSVKTNIGHTEAASGVAGLIKVALAMQRGLIPASLHFEQPNPAIDFERGRLAVAAQATPWPERGRAPLAGVNSFGFGGTNCHLVMEGAPAVQSMADAQAVQPIADAQAAPRNAQSMVAEAESGGASYHPLLVSAHSAAALDQRLAQLGALPAEAALHDVSLTLSRGRTHLPWRAALICRDAGELRDKLARNDVVRADRRAAPEHQPVFVFSGHGSQWADMGRALWDREPVFREALQACSDALQVHSGWSVAERVRDGQLASKLARVDDIQPAIFAFQVALTHTLRHYGVQPAAVIGHSMGEVAAAYAAGAVSLQDAALLTWSRGEVLARISGRGGMLSIALATADAEEVLGAFPALSVAVDSGTGYTVVSGALEALDGLAEKLARDGVEAKRVNVDVAAHSVQIDPLAADLQHAVRSIQPRSTPVAMFSSVTGQQVQGDALGPAYWTRNIRQPVRFGPAMRQLLAEGHRTFVEVSPHPLLLFILRELGKGSGAKLTLAGLMRRGRHDEEALLEGLARLHNAGCVIDWSSRERGRYISLPPYPWQRRRFWPQASAGGGFEATVEAHGQRGSRTPGAGRSLSDGARGDELQLRLDPARRAVMRQHVVAGQRLLSAGVAIAQLSRAAALLTDDAIELHALAFTRPIRVEHGAVTMTLTAERFELTSAADTEPALSGTIRPCNADGAAQPMTLPPTLPSFAELRDTSAQPSAAHYARLSTRGVHYHGALRSARRLWHHPGHGVGAALLEIDAGSAPAVQLDACFQATMAALATDEAAVNEAAANEVDPDEAAADKSAPREADPVAQQRWLVAQIGRVVLAPSAQARFAYGWVQRRPEGLSGGAWLLDEQGRPCSALDGVAFAQAPSAELPSDALKHITWTSQPLPEGVLASTQTTSPWRLSCDDEPLTRALREVLPQQGVPLLEPSLNGAPSEQLLIVLHPPPTTLNAEAAEHSNADAAAHSNAEAATHSDAVAAEHMCAALLRAIRPLPASTKRIVVACTHTPDDAGEAIESHNSDRPVSVSPATLAAWAMARVLAVEHPDLTLHCIQWSRHDPTALAHELRVLAPSKMASSELAHSAQASGAPTTSAPQPPSEIILQAASRWQPTLSTCALAPPPTAPAPGRGAVLVSGGLGGIGRHICADLIDAGYEELLVLGRSPLNEETEALLQDWSAQLAAKHGERGRANYQPIDVSDRNALAQLLSQRSPDRPILGVIHAAATIADNLLRDLTEEQLAAVFAAKARGAYWLHQLTADMDLSFFVLFGSLGSWVGLPGQGAYAAANAFIDGLAEQRRQTGLPALCIGWCGWRDTGFAASAAGEHALSLLADHGYATLDTSAAIKLFRAMLTAQLPARVAVMPPAAPTDPHTRSAETADKGPRLVEQLRALQPPSRRLAALEQRLAEHVAAVLRQEVERVEVDRPLREQGLDSMMTVELRDRLEGALGMPLSRTLVWQYPTVARLADHLLATLQLHEDKPIASPEPELDALLSTIEGMTEEAVKDLLDGR